MDNIKKKWIYQYIYLYNLLKILYAKYMCVKILIIVYMVQLLLIDCRPNAL